MEATDCQRNCYQICDQIRYQFGAIGATAGPFCRGHGTHRGLASDEPAGQLIRGDRIRPVVNAGALFAAVALSR